jgi:hypothetical protein
MAVKNMKYGETAVKAMYYGKFPVWESGGSPPVPVPSVQPGDYQEPVSLTLILPYGYQEMEIYYSTNPNTSKDEYIRYGGEDIRITKDTQIFTFGKFNSKDTEIAKYEYKIKLAIMFSSEDPITLSVSQRIAWSGTIEYSLDYGNTWSIWDGSLISGNRILMRGIGNKTLTYGSDMPRKWDITGNNIHCTGNMETLLDYQTVERGGHPPMKDHCCTQMFYKCTSLVEAPDLLTPDLAARCYYLMFSGCTSLVKPPKLPAAVLASSCYCEMFSNCTSLVESPELPAPVLVAACYQNMFSGCIALNKITAGFRAYYADSNGSWVTGVSPSGTFICPAELANTRGTSNIPAGWTRVDK